jgi:transcriptional regulator GlxA family with amidase domain
MVIDFIRINAPCILLKTSHASVDHIAAEVGYAEGVILRALLRRRRSCGVREIRRNL